MSVKQRTISENSCGSQKIRDMSVRELEAEWLRVNAAVNGFGLSRPFLFELIKAGKIRSVHIKRPGAEKGIRLIEVQSLRDFIRSFEALA